MDDLNSIFHPEENNLTRDFMGLAEEVHAWIGNIETPYGGIIGVIDSPAIISCKFPGNRYGSLEVVYSPEMIEDSRYSA